MIFSFLPPARSQSRYIPRPLQHTATSKKLVASRLLRQTPYSVSFRFTQYPVKRLIIGAEGGSQGTPEMAHSTPAAKLRVQGSSKRRKTAKNRIRKPLQPKPDVEIWRK